MRVTFLGSPEFAVPALRGVHAEHQIAAVYCQPPRPAGRGQVARRCAVHVAADALGLMVRHPERLRRDEVVQQAFEALRLDVAIVAAYGLILPQRMLDAPHRGCLNIHASLLPRWRGAAPIQAAILAGDAQSGVTIMQMEAGLDTGPMLLSGPVALAPDTTTPMLHDALSLLGRDLILRTLQEWPPAVAQPEAGATYATKLTRADARIDWSQSATAIERRIRALQPWPGTETTLDGATLKILAAVALPGDGPPGLTLDDRLTVGCGEGRLRLMAVQLAGRSAQAADAFLRGRPVSAGTKLG